MKKILQLFILCLATSVTYGQTLFSIDFEDGTLGEMTMVDNDKNTPFSPNVADYTEAWNVRAGINDVASGVAVSNSWYSPAGMADDWLITPQLSISDPQTAISWEAVAIDPNYPDGYEVRISTTDNEIASFTDVLWSTSAEQASGQLAMRIASLEDYAGQDIYIAFRNNSFDKFLLALDNITVKVIQARDVTVNGFTGAKYHEKGNDIPVTVNITNNGSETLTSVDLTWSDGGEEKTTTITGLNLMTGESADITSDEVFIATEAISYPLTIYTSNPNGDTDLAQGDDLITAVVAGVSYIPNRKIVVEEGTGTWCGWCPRGAVGLDAMAVKYPDNFIGIAVHNNDPMAIASYDGPLGITSFPEGRVNRIIASDPGANALDELIPILRSFISPMAPTASAMGNVVDRTIEINAETEFVTQLDDIDFRLAAVVVEDGVTGTASGYAQANYYSGGGAGNMAGYENLPDPVPASDMVYDHVARVILGGFDGVEGSVPSSVVEGDIASYNFTYNVPASFDMKNMKVAILVIDNVTGEILNGEEVDVMIPLNSTEVDESISRIYPNPVSGLANVELNIQESSDVNLQVLDLMGKTVSNQYLGRLNGSYNMTYDVSNLDAGMYLFRVTAGDLVSTKKITVIK